MATYKKASTQTADRHTGASDIQREAERMAGSLGQSAQQVWLAGIGALGRAQAEGTRLFETLVAEGEQLERQARKSASSRAGEVIQAVGDSVGEARARAGDTWDRWEQAFDDRMQRTLARLGVPRRDDVAELSRRIDELTAELRNQRRTQRPRKAPSKRSAAAKPAAAATTPASPPATRSPEPAAASRPAPTPPTDRPDPTD